MYCGKCGAELASDSSFCHYCGSSIKSGNGESGQNSPTNLMDATNTGGPRGYRKSIFAGRKAKMSLAAGGTILLLAVVGLGADLWYVHKQSSLALAAAQNDQFSTAVSFQEKAVEFGLHKAPLEQKLVAYKFGLQVRHQLEAANTAYNQQQWDKSTTGYDSVAKALQGRSEPWLVSLRKAALTGAEQSTLRGLETEAGNTADISTIVAIYHQVGHYTDKLGQAAQSTVATRLDFVTAQAIQKDLSTNDFAAATAKIEAALAGPTNDAHLVQLQQAIADDKQAYEQRQQSILTTALAQEAAITNTNQSPLQVIKVKTAIDTQGNLVATGKVKNIGTNLVGSISLEVDFYDDHQQLVDSENVDVTPDPLPAQQTASFSVSVSSALGAVSAKVSNYTWRDE